MSEIIALDLVNFGIFINWIPLHILIKIFHNKWAKGLGTGDH